MPQSDKKRRAPRYGRDLEVPVFGQAQGQQEIQYQAPDVSITPAGQGRVTEEGLSFGNLTPRNPDQDKFNALETIVKGARTSLDFMGQYMRQKDKENERDLTEIRDNINASRRVVQTDDQGNVVYNEVISDPATLADFLDESGQPRKGAHIQALSPEEKIARFREESKSLRGRGFNFDRFSDSISRGFNSDVDEQYNQGIQNAIAVTLNDNSLSYNEKVQRIDNLTSGASTGVKQYGQRVKMELRSKNQISSIDAVDGRLVDKILMEAETAARSFAEDPSDPDGLFTNFTNADVHELLIGDDAELEQVISDTVAGMSQKDMESALGGLTEIQMAKFNKYFATIDKLKTIKERATNESENRGISATNGTQLSRLSGTTLSYSDKIKTIVNLRSTLKDDPNPERRDLDFAQLLQQAFGGRDQLSVTLNRAPSEGNPVREAAFSTDKIEVESLEDAFEIFVEDILDDFEKEYEAANQTWDLVVEESLRRDIQSSLQGRFSSEYASMLDGLVPELAGNPLDFTNEDIVTNAAQRLAGQLRLDYTKFGGLTLPPELQDKAKELFGDNVKAGNLRELLTTAGMQYLEGDAPFTPQQQTFLATVLNANITNPEIASLATSLEGFFDTISSNDRSRTNAINANERGFGSRYNAAAKTTTEVSDMRPGMLLPAAVDGSSENQVAENLAVSITSGLSDSIITNSLDPTNNLSFEFTSNGVVTTTLDDTGSPTVGVSNPFTSSTPPEGALLSIWNSEEITALRGKYQTFANWVNDNGFPGQGDTTVTQAEYDNIIQPGLEAAIALRSRADSLAGLGNDRETDFLEFAMFSADPSGQNKNLTYMMSKSRGNPYFTQATFGVLNRIMNRINGQQDLVLGEEQTRLRQSIYEQLITDEQLEEIKEHRYKNDPTYKEEDFPSLFIADILNGEDFDDHLTDGTSEGLRELYAGLETPRRVGSTDDVVAVRDEIFGLLTRQFGDAEFEPTEVFSFMGPMISEFWYSTPTGAITPPRSRRVPLTEEEKKSGKFHPEVEASFTIGSEMRMLATNDLRSEGSPVNEFSIYNRAYEYLTSPLAFTEALSVHYSPTEGQESRPAERFKHLVGMFLMAQSQGTIRYEAGSYTFGDNEYVGMLAQAVAHSIARTGTRGLTGPGEGFEFTPYRLAPWVIEPGFDDENVVLPQRDGEGTMSMPMDSYIQGLQYELVKAHGRWAGEDVTVKQGGTPPSELVLGQKKYDRWTYFNDEAWALAGDKYTGTGSTSTNLVAGRRGGGGGVPLTRWAIDTLGLVVADKTLQLESDDAEGKIDLIRRLEKRLSYLDNTYRSGVMISPGEQRGRTLDQGPDDPRTIEQDPMTGFNMDAAVNLQDQTTVGVLRLNIRPGSSAADSYHAVQIATQGSSRLISGNGFVGDMLGGFEEMAMTQPYIGQDRSRGYLLRGSFGPEALMTSDPQMQHARLTQPVILGPKTTFSKPTGENRSDTYFSRSTFADDAARGIVEYALPDLGEIQVTSIVNMLSDNYFLPVLDALVDQGFVQAYTDDGGLTQLEGRDGMGLLQIQTALMYSLESFGYVTRDSSGKQEGQQTLKKRYEGGGDLEYPIERLAAEYPGGKDALETDLQTLFNVTSKTLRQFEQTKQFGNGQPDAPRIRIFHNNENLTDFTARINPGYLAGRSYQLSKSGKKDYGQSNPSLLIFDPNKSIRQQSEQGLGQGAFFNFAPSSDYQRFGIDPLSGQTLLNFKLSGTGPVYYMPLTVGRGIRFSGGTR